MRPSEDNRFPWPLFFIVTAVSFFIFSFLTRLIDGSPAHVSLFFKIAAISLILSVISGIFFLMSGEPAEK
jgi:hypothetical protein